MSVALTVCGSAGSHTGPGRACSGYLLRSGDSAIMLDCGNGSTANLQTVMDFADLDAVVVSHRHVDHCMDLVGMFHQLRFGPGGPRQVDLYAAPGVVEVLTGVLSEAPAFREVFRCREVAAGDHVDVGPFAIDLYPAAHPPPTLSMRIEVGDHVLAYSADSGGDQALVECARGADLFLCEATWQGDGSDIPPDIHLTATQAGELARKVGVPRLMITHVLGSLDPQASRKEASKAFGGDVELAVQGESTTI